ncbi:hypothetical protein NKR23_g2120 [Pleurostoma richardsiae]|uniref:Uncharacterized protein n=1 Tax=Pleurostoma richardsiae TaxID=41990 RepID=A0AA38VIY9_9PEZI|nr:hypothetical protein NKR23_g2120 [Pleurostoma richardsiae]
MPFREHFDVVSGIDYGIFFVITMFVEGWTQEDCTHHLPRLFRVKRGRKGRISFGKGLDWDLRDLRYFNGAHAAVESRKKIFSNYLPTYETYPAEGVKRRASDAAHLAEGSDISIHYEGGAYSGELLRTVVFSSDAGCHLGLPSWIYW